MKKLVVASRLHRPKTFAYRVSENREGSSCIHGLTNPLYTFIIATDLRDGINLGDLVNRFFDINKTLKRLEVVRGLCVLDNGTVTWGYENSYGEKKPALFMKEDLYLPIFPIFHQKPANVSALYPLVTDLLLHLFQSILAPEDIAPSYGPATHTASYPTSSEIVLDPDPEWLEKLNHFCAGEQQNNDRLPYDIVWDPFNE